MHWGEPWEGYKPCKLGMSTEDGGKLAVGFWGATEPDVGLDWRKGLAVGLDGGIKGDASSGYAIWSNCRKSVVVASLNRMWVLTWVHVLVSLHVFYTCKMEVQYSSVLIPPTSTNLFLCVLSEHDQPFYNRRTKNRMATFFVRNNILSKISDSKKKRAQNGSVWKIFRDSLIIEPKCLVWSRESYSGVSKSNYCRVLCALVGSHEDTYWASPFKAVKCSDRSHGRCRSPQS